MYVLYVVMNNWKEHLMFKSSVHAKKEKENLKKSAWENWPKDVINNKTGCKEGDILSAGKMAAAC